MHVMRPLVLLLVLAAGSAGASAQSRFLQWAVEDARALGGQTFRFAPAAGASAAAVLMASRGIDPDFNSGIQAWAEGPVDAFLNRTNPLGGPSMTRNAAGVFAITLIVGDEKAQDAAFTSLEALVYSGCISYALKYAFGRGRPGEGFEPDHFRPFSGHSSFPSGHTTAAFAAITPWVLYYRTPVAKALLVLPLGTALARMDRDKHWASDVLAGGALGVLTARFLVRRHQGIPGGQARPQVSIHPGGASVQFRF